MIYIMMANFYDSTLLTHMIIPTMRSYHMICHMHIYALYIRVRSRNCHE